MPANASWKRKQYAVMTQNALRQLIAGPRTCRRHERLPPLQRPLALAVPAPRGGRGGPRAAGDRAGHAAAGGHGALAPLVRRAERSARCSRSTARSRLGFGAFEEGIAAAATAPAQPVLVTVFLEGGADALSVLSPQGDPLYRKLRPKLALRGGTAVRRGRPPALASRGGRRSRQLYGEEKVTRHAGRRLHERRPVALHVAPLLGGRRDERNLRTGWLGRYLDRVGTTDNPLQGLSLDNSLAPALATAKVPVASIDGPDQYDFWSNSVWGEVEQRMLAAIGSLGAPGASDPALASRGARQQRRSTGCARSSCRSRADKPGSRARSPYPKSSDAFPKRLAGLAAMLGAGLPLRVVVAERARALRHARRPGGRARAGAAD